MTCSNILKLLLNAFVDNHIRGQGIGKKLLVNSDSRYEKVGNFITKCVIVVVA